ncbi:MAG TPA: MFS transporter [Bacteroidota bacterium]
MAHSLQTTTDPYGSLRYPEFRSLVIASFLLTIGLLAQEVAIGYELYKITRDPFALGMIGLVEAVPFISLSLFGGHIADRYRKRRILLWSVGGIAMSSLVLHFFSEQGRHLPQSILLLVIYAAIFVIGLCRAFQSPTSTSLRAFLVPVSLYENASTWSSSAWQVGAIVGPAISGFLYSWLGFSNTLLVVVGLIGAAWLLYWTIGEKPVATINDAENLLVSINQGIRFVFKTKIILYSISLDLFSVLFGGVVAILPIFAEDILHVGAEGLGILRAAPSLGAVLTLMVLARVSPMNHAWRNLLVAVVGFGISIVVFAVSPWLSLSVAALFLSGAFDSISVVIRATILQVMTPDEIRGRVMAVNGIFLASSNELGAFESGLAAKIMGTVPSAVFGGVMTLLIVGWMYLNSSDLLKTDVAQSRPDYLSAGTTRRERRKGG